MTELDSHLDRLAQSLFPYVKILYSTGPGIHPTSTEDAPATNIFWGWVLVSGFLLHGAFTRIAGMPLRSVWKFPPWDSDHLTHSGVFRPTWQQRPCVLSAWASLQKPPHAVKSLAILLKPQSALWAHLIGRIASADVVCPGGHTDPHCQPGIFHVLAGVGDVSALLQGTGQQGHSMEIEGTKFRVLP